MNHKRHAAHCTVCQHPELKAIEARFLDWESPQSLEISYGLPQTSVYRHAKAFNLYETRQDNVLERLIERGVEQLPDINTTNLIEATDDASAPRVIVVNEVLVPFLPGGNPIGTRIHHVGSEEWLTIVGVVRSLRHSSLLQPPEASFFGPYQQSESWRRMYVAVRGAGPDPATMTSSVRQAVWSVDPTIPVDDVRTLQEIVDTSLFVVLLPTRLMGVFGAVALLLSAVGLYGLMAYLVAQRSREVGIRIALGARRSDVLRLVMGRGLRLASVGIILGVAMAFPMGRVLALVLEGVNANEPLIYLGVPAVLLVVTLLASFVPARRALAVDPVVSLRSD